jgi:hypothetical protein
MAKQRLFPEKAPTDKQEPHDRFTDLAKRVVNVPKDEIDKRETQWRTAKRRKRR